MVEDIDLTAAEWRQVMNRLLLYAKWLVPSETVWGLGAGPDDLVQETVKRLWDPDSKVKWDTSFGRPTVSGVVAFLKMVLQRRLLDLLRKGDYKYSRTPLPEEDGLAENGVESGFSEDSPAVAINERIYLKQLFAQARAIAVERDDIELVFFLDLQQAEGPLANAEAATKLGLTTADIVNIRKRLSRICTVIPAKRARS